MVLGLVLAVSFLLACSKDFTDSEGRTMLTIRVTADTSEELDATVKVLEETLANVQPTQGGHGQYGYPKPGVWREVRAEVP